MYSDSSSAAAIPVDVFAELPAAQRDRIMAAATGAVLAWQQARRPAAGMTH